MGTVLCIYGNPKKSGFVHGCLDHVAGRLEAQGITIDRLMLCEADIKDCIGCFQCLRRGLCAIPDDMAGILDRIRGADGILTGASVRNGYFPALTKRFYERITYLLGFTRDLQGKPVLGIGAVGMMGGKKPLGGLVTYREFHTFVSDFLFFRTGIPTKLTVESVADRLDRATDRFARAIATRPPPALGARLRMKFDDWIMGRYMFARSPEVYAYIIARWKEAGRM